MCLKKKKLAFHFIKLASVQVVHQLSFALIDDMIFVIGSIGLHKLNKASEIQYSTILI